MIEDSNLNRESNSKSRQNAYIGKAGQLAVMAELALLGYNVSLPEIDKGEDVFVVNDDSHKLWRIQVKTATQQRRRNDNYQVRIHERQINCVPEVGATDLYFVFVLRDTIPDESNIKIAHWRFVVISRERLKKYIDDRALKGKPFGSLERKTQMRILSITLRNKKQNKLLGQTTCSHEPWNDYMESWKEVWPFLDHDEIAAAKRRG